MYAAHKRIRLKPGQCFIYLLKSLHWRTTGVEPNVSGIVYCAVNIDRQTPAFCQDPFFSHRLAGS